MQQRSAPLAGALQGDGRRQRGPGGGVKATVDHPTGSGSDRTIHDGEARACLQINRAGLFARATFQPIHSGGVNEAPTPHQALKGRASSPFQGFLKLKPRLSQGDALSFINPRLRRLKKVTQRRQDRGRG